MNKHASTCEMIHNAIWGEKVEGGGKEASRSWGKKRGWDFKGLVPIESQGVLSPWQGKDDGDELPDESSAKSRSRNRERYFSWRIKEVTKFVLMTLDDSLIRVPWLKFRFCCLPGLVQHNSLSRFRRLLPKYNVIVFSYIPCDRLVSITWYICVVINTMWRNDHIFSSFCLNYCAKQ